MAHYYESCAIQLKGRSQKKSKKNSWNKSLGVRFLDSELEMTPIQGAVEKYAHLREALASNEESQRLQRICRQLKVINHSIESIQDYFERNEMIYSRINLCWLPSFKRLIIAYKMNWIN